MKIKVFNIRLSKEHFHSDQDKINDFLEKVKFKKSTAAFVENPVNYWSVIIHYEEFEQSTGKSETKKPEISEADLTEDELEIAQNLKTWRTQQAQKEGLPAYMILSNLNIFTVAKQKPQVLADFENLKGFGEKKTERYAEEIIALLNSI